MMNISVLFIAISSLVLFIANPIIALMYLLYNAIVIGGSLCQQLRVHFVVAVFAIVIGYSVFIPEQFFLLLASHIKLFSVNLSWQSALELIRFSYMADAQSLYLLLLPIGFLILCRALIIYLQLKVNLVVRSLSEVNVNNNLVNGVEFGVESSSNKKVFVSDIELNQHALVIGTTGSGKTTTLMNIVDSCCQRNLPLIYVDGKGSIKLALRIQEICKKYKRSLKVFSLDPGELVPNLTCYNPLAYGNFTEWKNKIVTLAQDAEGKGQEHYSLQEQSYISLVCEVLNKSGVYVDIEGIICYIKDSAALQKLANRTDSGLAIRVAQAAQDIGNLDIIKILETFYYSGYGRLFSTSGLLAEDVINIQDSIKNGEIVLFLLDAASYKRDTNLLGRLIINDINAAWASFGRCAERYAGYCIFDEFASYAASNMASVLSMQRDNGLHAIVGTQSIHAISVESSNVKRVAVELIANCNTFIIHKLNDPKDIELLVNTIGTRCCIESNHIRSINSNNLQISTRFTDKPLLKAQSIRELKSGYGFVCRTLLPGTLQQVKFNNID